MVRLECLVKLKYESIGSSTFILNVEPASTSHQRIVSEDFVMTGTTATPRRSITPEGSRFIHAQAGGIVEVTSRFTVDIRHDFADPANVHEVLPHQMHPELLKYTAPSRYCESDKLMAFAQGQFGWQQPGYGRVLNIAKWVRENVEFKVGTTGWQTSAADVLNQRQGVCRDFAHVMISMCRALNMPARFVTGVDYGADPSLGPVDFHAYVEVFLGDRWYLFDPTGISPTTGLLRFGTGRDAADVSFATIFGAVNSWAPYLEINAVVDPANGLLLPERTDMPVSTADGFAENEEIAAPLLPGQFPYANVGGFSARGDISGGYPRHQPSANSGGHRA